MTDMTSALPVIIETNTSHQHDNKKHNTAERFPPLLQEARQL